VYETQHAYVSRPVAGSCGRAAGGRTVSGEDESVHRGDGRLPPVSHSGHRRDGQGIGARVLRGAQVHGRRPGRDRDSSAPQHGRRTHLVAGEQVAHLGPRLPRNPHMPEHKKKKDMGGPDEQTVNNPVAIAARDGTVHLLYCVEYMRAFHIRSDDDGVTWSAPVEITSAFDQYRSELDWQVIATGPGHAVQLQSGRLVAPFWMATYEQQPRLRKGSGSSTATTTAETWQRGDIVIRNAGEPNIVELPDGRVLVTARNTDPRNRRVAAYSPDGATGWSKPEFIEDLLEPGCMAGIVSHPGGRHDQDRSCCSPIRTRPSAPTRTE
jgi:hypothetical protein